MVLKFSQVEISLSGLTLAFILNVNCLFLNPVMLRCMLRSERKESKLLLENQNNLGKVQRNSKAASINHCCIAQNKPKGR